MSTYCRIAAAAVCGMLLGLPAAQAQQPTKTISIELGTWEGDFRLTPEQVTLTAGEHYRLVFVNWSREHRHIIMSPEFERAVLTQTIQTYPGREKVRFSSFGSGIQVPPGERVEVFFVPYQQGSYKLFCQDRIHTHAGMELTVDIKI